MGKLIIFGFMLFSQVSTAFWSSEVDEVGETLLYSYIEKGDFTTFKESFGSAKSSKTKGKLEEGFGHYLLGYATSTENWPQVRKLGVEPDDYICLPQFVGLILGNGALATENPHQYSSKADIRVGHLSGAINNLCEESVKLLLEKMSSQDIAIATKKFRLQQFEGIKNNQKYADRLVNITMALAEKNKSKCSNDNSNCDGLEHIKKELASFEKIEKEEMAKKAFYRTAEGQKELERQDYCEHKSEYERYLALISEEKEKGKISGYVDASLLKKWGDQAFENGKALKNKSYKCN